MTRLKIRRDDRPYRRGFRIYWQGAADPGRCFAQMVRHNRRRGWGWRISLASGLYVVFGSNRALRWLFTTNYDPGASAPTSRAKEAGHDD